MPEVPPIGILILPFHWRAPPGNPARSDTFAFPVIHEVLYGVTFNDLVSCHSRVEAEVVAAAQSLVSRGAAAVVGSNGSFASYQKAVAAAVNVPAYMSSMTQVPWILAGMRPSEKLGVVAAWGSAITDRVYEQCDIPDPERLKILSAAELPEFRAMVQGQDYSPEQLERELVDWLSPALLTGVGALVLQCSDLPPFSAALARSTGLNVHDVTGLAAWVHHAAVPPRDAVGASA